MELGKLGRALRLSISEGALACAMGTLTGGVFLTGFALALGASRFQIGLLAAMPALANVAQLAGACLIEHTGQRKRICLGAVSLSRLIWLLVLAAPLFVGVGGWLVWALISLLGVSSVLNAIGGVGWLSWIKDLVPETIRISFLSRRNQIDTVLALSLSIAGGAFIDWWGERNPGSIGGFVIVFAAAMLCGLVALPLMAAIPEPPGEQPDRRRPPLRRLLVSPLRETNFRRLLGFYAYWNLAVNLAAPFYAVYMLEQLHLPFWRVTVLSTLSSVCGLLANRFWTRLSEKFGHRPIVFLATLGDALYPLWWLFVSPQWAWVLLPIHCSGVFNAPLAVGPNNIVLKLSPHRNASPYMAVFSAVVGPVTALAAMGGGYLAEAFAGLRWNVGPLELGGLQLLFLISAVGRLTSLGLLWRVVEPRAESIGHVVRVLRRVHSMSPRSWLPAFDWGAAARRRFVRAGLTPVAGQVPFAALASAGEATIRLPGQEAPARSAA
jgi:MFS family permease